MAFSEKKWLRIANKVNNKAFTGRQRRSDKQEVNRQKWKKNWYRNKVSQVWMASKDCKEAEATASGPGSSPVLPVVHHTPMSERQQLALIKKLEKAAKQNEGGKKPFWSCPMRSCHYMNGYNVCNLNLFLNTIYTPMTKCQQLALIKRLEKAHTPSAKYWNKTKD